MKDQLLSPRLSDIGADSKKERDGEGDTDLTVALHLSIITFHEMGLLSGGRATAAALARLYSADPVNPIRVPEKRAGERAPVRERPQSPRNAFPFIEYRGGIYEMEAWPADASELTRARDGATIYAKAAAPRFNALSFSLSLSLSLSLFSGESEQLGAEQGV